MALDFPDSPAVGDLYGSTDTMWRWDGEIWASTAGASGQRGIVALGAMTGFTAAAIEANVMIPVTNTITFTPVAGRYYRIRCNVRAVAPSVATSGWLRVITNNAAIPLHDNWSAVPSAYANMLLEVPFLGNGVSSTFSVNMNLGAAGTYYTDQVSSYFYIEDITYEAGTAGISMQPTPWINATYEAGWSTLTGFLPAAYRKVGDEVQIRGLVTGGTIPSTIFILPVGFRPPNTLHLGTVANSLFAHSHVHADGRVTASVGVSSWFDISSLRFSVTP